MIQFRKAGLRTHYRIEGNHVTMVRNMERRSVVDVSDGNPVILCDAMDSTKVITEQEFREAFDIAIQRITKMEI